MAKTQTVVVYAYLSNMWPSSATHFLNTRYPKMGGQGYILYITK